MRQTAFQKGNHSRSIVYDVRFIIGSTMTLLQNEATRMFWETNHFCVGIVFAGDVRVEPLGADQSLVQVKEECCAGL